MVPAALAFVTSIFITLYIASTSQVLLMIHPNQTRLRVKPPVEFSIINTPYQMAPAAGAGGGRRHSNQSQAAAGGEFSDYLPRVSTPVSSRPLPVNVISQSRHGEFTAAVNSSGKKSPICLQSSFLLIFIQNYYMFIYTQNIQYVEFF